MFEIKFKTGGSAFKEDYLEHEVVRILQRVKESVIDGSSGGPVMDINGNKIGYWRIDLGVGHEER